LTTLEFDTAYHSFNGEVEASTTPTICRLHDLHRHQLSTIAPPIDAVLSLDTLATDRINLNSVIFGGGERTGTPRNRPTPR